LDLLDELLLPTDQLRCIRLLSLKHDRKNAKPEVTEYPREPIQAPIAGNIKRLTQSYCCYFRLITAPAARVVGLAHYRREAGLAKFCQTYYAIGMSTMNISLPDTLKSFVDEQVAARGYGTSSEYVRELIRKEQERQQLRNLLLEGATSAPSAPANEAYFEGLRDRVRQRKSA
jgi:antitoxin ParD1/3/4